MTKKENVFDFVIKSKFIRSIFLQLICIFLCFSIAIFFIVFFSFSSEINKNIIKEKENQLSSIVDTFSKRIDETKNIAFSIGNDSLFYLSGSDLAGTDDEIKETLKRYIAGNTIIKYLSFYRASEPETIYSSIGVVPFETFYNSNLQYDNYTYQAYRALIESCQKDSIYFLPSSDKEKDYISFIYPLIKKQNTFVIMHIPYEKADDILSNQLNGSLGAFIIYDNNKNELYRLSTLTKQLPADLLSYDNNKQISINGSKYIVQKNKSNYNLFTYVSVIKMNDIVSKLILKQIIFVVSLFLLMIVAIFIMLKLIIRKYKPINNLAQSLTDEDSKMVINESDLIENSISTLKENNEKFETAYLEAEAANKAKSAFLSNMSHDIRTPMNAIIGMTQIATKHFDDPEYVKECLLKVQDASDYLLDIINNILDISRIESGKFTLSEEKIELPKLIYSIVNIINQNIEAKNISLLIETYDIDNEIIFGDGVRLTQVFMNILSNSIKFTNNNGQIKLIIKQEEIDNEYGTYKFIFSDTGIGMSDEFVSKVFDTFSRDKNAIMQIEGTGLGMAIAKSLVELMGGTITCDSKINVGTTFTIKIKMKYGSEPFIVKEKYNHMNVLIVGKEKETINNQAEIFKEFHTQVDCVSTIGKIKKAYEIVLINQTRTDKSGIKTLNSLLNSMDKANTKFILASKDFVGIDQSGAMDAGISDFVRIPIFKSTVKDILEGTIISKKNKKITNINNINLEGKKLLMVEDNEVNREIARRIISETKITIVEAVNGSEAVEKFSKSPEGYFNIILMDIQMPIMNGYEATKQIRNLDRKDASSIPIYALTANTFDEDVRQVKEAGMNGHIGKPYVPEELITTLDKVINNK